MIYKHPVPVTVIYCAITWSRCGCYARTGATVWIPHSLTQGDLSPATAFFFGARLRIARPDRRPCYERRPAVVSSRAL